MDFDTTSKKGSHEKIVKEFGSGKYQILLGTQMIAKGLDFPNVTLVGVINADTSLSIPSYKSSENTYQLLSQVAGRSGRSEKNGEVVIQTFNPDHYAIIHAKNNNYLAFYITDTLFQRVSPIRDLNAKNIGASDKNSLHIIQTQNRDLHYNRTANRNLSNKDD